jgi:hypothetical protein
MATVTMGTVDEVKMCLFWNSSITVHLHIFMKMYKNLWMISSLLSQPAEMSQTHGLIITYPSADVLTYGDWLRTKYSSNFHQKCK